MTLVLTLIIYFAATVTIGFWRSGKASMSEYVAADNSTGAFLLTCSLVGTTVGGGMFLGIAQMGFERPISALTIGLVYCAGGLIIGYFAPYMRAKLDSSGGSTLFGLVSQLFPTSSSGKASVIPPLFVMATFLCFILMLAVQYVGIAAFLAFYSNIQHDTAILLCGSVVSVLGIVSYAVSGGFRRDLSVDLLQVSVITFGVAALLFLVLTKQSPPDLRTLPPEIVKVGSHDAILLVGVVFLLLPTFLVRFDLWQRVRTARTNNTARLAFLLAGLISFTFFIAFATIGLLARAAGVTDSRSAALLLMDEMRGSVAYGLIIASFFAAVVSSADTFLGVSGLATSRMAAKVMSLPTNSDGFPALRVIRWSTFAVGVTAVLFGYAIRDIVDLFTSAFGLLSVFLPAFLFAASRRATTPRGTAVGQWSVISGMAVCVSLTMIAPTIAFVIPFLVAVVVLALEIFVKWLLGDRDGNQATTI